MNETSIADWRTVKIGDICSVGRGSSPRPIKDQKYFRGGNIPWIKIADATSSGKYLYHTKQYVNEFGASFSRLLPKGSLIVAASGTLGYTQLLGVEGCIHDGWLYLDNFDEQVAREFLYYLFKDRVQFFYNSAYGAAIQNINTTILREMEILLPSIETQRKITAVLSAYDDLIENNSRRIAILEEMAQALYREWFVHFRFPGHESAEFVEVDGGNGRLPKGWEIRPLGEWCELVMGQSPKSQFYNEEGDGLPFHQGVKDFGQRFPADRVYCTIEKRIAEEEDILFSVRAPVGRMNVANKKIVIGRGLSAIRSKTGHQAFLFQQLKQQFQEEDMMGGGTIFKSVTKKDMQGIALIIPTSEILDGFEKIMYPMFRQLEILTMKNANLRQTRDLLLPRLISGDLDVSHIQLFNTNK
jgi:type I restriction enzyme, S subunit